MRNTGIAGGVASSRRTPGTNIGYRQRAQQEQVLSSNPRHFQQERRDFIRVKEECSVDYRFLGEVSSVDSEAAYRGRTNNISGGGLKLLGPLPNPDWVPMLLLGKVALAVDIHLPGEAAPARAMARIAWIEAAEAKSHEFLLGLRFKEISSEDRERIIKFIIRKQVK
jgi:c-di-GMP-binding flagellar brake protein YcgR